MKNFFLQLIANTAEIRVPRVEADDASMASLLNTVYLIAGIIAVIVIVIGGYMYTTSAGEPARTKRAKDTILYAVVGIVIILMAFSLTWLVLGSVS